MNDPCTILVDKKYLGIHDDDMNFNMQAIILITLYLIAISWKKPYKTKQYEYKNKGTKSQG